jgi:transcription regulator MmyB-like protein
MRILDRLADTPAQVMSELGETLIQAATARAVFGDETRHQRHMRSIGYRWFMDPGTYTTPNKDMCSSCSPPPRAPRAERLQLLSVIGDQRMAYKR